MGYNIQNMRSCLVTRTALVEIANATASVVTWQSAISNRNGLWSSSSNPTRITVDKSGLYLATASVTWEAGATGLRTVKVKKNGVADTYPIQASQAAPASGTGLQQVSGFVYLASGDYLELEVTQSDGAGLDLLFDATQETPSFGVALIHPEYTSGAAGEAE